MQLPIRYATENLVDDDVHVMCSFVLACIEFCVGYVGFFCSELSLCFYYSGNKSSILGCQSTKETILAFSYQVYDVVPEA